LRINQSIVSTIAIVKPEVDRLNSEFIISEEGFPWGIDTESLLMGDKEDMYFNENKSFT